MQFHGTTAFRRISAGRDQYPGPMAPARWGWWRSGRSQRGSDVPRNPARRNFMRAALAVVAAAVVLAPIELTAQTPMVPYFGKTQIRYTNFRWNIYTTAHFELYYYPEEEQHMERA